eukprot:5012361-Lingulodinium_polyedra.AAC.1
MAHSLSHSRNSPPMSRMMTRTVAWSRPMVRKPPSFLRSSAMRWSRLWAGKTSSTRHCSTMPP